MRTQSGNMRIRNNNIGENYCYYVGLASSRVFVVRPLQLFVAFIVVARGTSAMDGCAAQQQEGKASRIRTADRRLRTYRTYIHVRDDDASHAHYLRRMAIAFVTAGPTRTLQRRR